MLPEKNVMLDYDKPLKRLNSTHRKAAELRLRKMTAEQIADELDVHVVTVRRWFTDPLFKDEMERRRVNLDNSMELPTEEWWAQELAKGRQLVHEARDALGEIIRDREANAAARVAAIRLAYSVFAPANVGAGEDSDAVVELRNVTKTMRELNASNG